ncbi:MAG: glycosyltransferase family 4 protein [Desulfomonile tiedjei]|uniref:Glycosyltransferase family 4 protein n=1 Tax=Desulfomonile tiedjei TaxID=2358 RepID=A0A9D6V6L0_9BACT|nr:glycosyltransferase family 4 protein [Desulfomonile tiedjei]
MSVNLVLFLTRGGALRTGAMLGLLEREVSVYRRLMEHDFRVSFITYGDTSDLNYQEKLGGIRVLCNEGGIPPEKYEAALLTIHARALEDCHVIKTNQSNGAEFALQAARNFKKLLVARCGYMWSFNSQREFGYDSLEAQHARSVEENVFSSADKIVVTTEAMRLDIVRRIPRASARTRIIPNYVDTELFRPRDAIREPNSLIYVGRIAPEKNLEALLEAVSELPVSLMVVGEGRLRPALQQRFSDLDGRVTWEGNIPNSQLPGLFNLSEIFILPSLYEGHPKTLIEAMSCGLPAIGGDSPGIREVISHGKNGYLCGTDSNAIRRAILELTKNPGLKSKLGENAREHALENYSLDRILELEEAVLLDVARQ